MDEAQTFAPSGEMTARTGSTLSLASQARKYGLGLIFATQSQKGLHNQVPGNAATPSFSTRRYRLRPPGNWFGPRAGTCPGSRNFVRVSSTSRRKAPGQQGAYLTVPEPPSQEPSEPEGGHSVRQHRANVI